MGTRLSGRGGVAPDVAARVGRLLIAGWPKARIARETRVSRMTVHRIAAGEHVSCDGRPAVRGVARNRAKIPRCKCGYRTRQPCRVCLAEEYKAQQRAKYGPQALVERPGPDNLFQLLIA